ncbi:MULTISPECIES: DUF1573 domain-containing protein [unclassified Sphingobacterium]|uniref:DUF1573 domain-containing protein n=1 Tax=unclassified Sphingobacterium TaxID=2609468 RepID=UPI0020C1F888|nr:MULTISPECIES: DUF1573 domain-containing protein [unclassified Sphingobacterium]
MKKLILSFVAATVLFASCNQEGKKADADAQNTTETVATKGNDGIGKMQFEETVYDFGKIKEGEVVKHVFKFENTGTSPVILSQVSASCGCTTPTFTTTPVLPGKVGEIAVEFNSSGQVGQQQKIITIASNAEANISTVQLKGEVEAI